MDHLLKLGKSSYSDKLKSQEYSWLYFINSTISNIENKISSISIFPSPSLYININPIFKNLFKLSLKPTNFSLKIEENKKTLGAYVNYFLRFLDITGIENINNHIPITIKTTVRNS